MLDFDLFVNNVVKGLDLNKFHQGKINEKLISVHFYPMIVIFENL